jgi:hypothetical protein
MTSSTPRGDAYLRALLFGKAVIAGAVREPGTTRHRPTVVTALRWWFALTAASLVLVACSPSKGGGDTYARGTQVQEQCCEHLQGSDRDTCLGEVVRVGDPAASRTATNQQTFACVVEHFVCDPQTGRETQASAQAQLDCTEDLQ